MGRIAENLLVLSNPTRNLTEALVKDIHANRFAQFAHGTSGPVHSNHPAWVIGHLAIYPHKALELLGDDSGTAPAAWDELFGNGSPLHDDSDHSIYPSKEELVKTCLAEMDRATEQLAQTADDAFLAPQPVERWRERMPTVGDTFAFLLGPHAMFHLGQLSAWRRFEGLGSAM
jgi:hypothetical protein